MVDWMKIGWPLHSNTHRLIISFIISENFTSHIVMCDVCEETERRKINCYQFPISALCAIEPFELMISCDFFYTWHFVGNEFYEWKRLKRSACVRVYCCWRCVAHVVHTKYIGLVTTKSWMKFPKVSNRYRINDNSVTTATDTTSPSNSRLVTGNKN